jgi:hypothetical protein
VPLLAVERFVDTWLSAPAGTLNAMLIIDMKRHHQPNSSIDLVPLVKLRRDNRDFDFFVNNVVEDVPAAPPGMTRRDDVRYIEDVMDKTEVSSGRVCFYVKQ